MRAAVVAVGLLATVGATSGAGQEEGTRPPPAQWFLGATLAAGGELPRAMGRARPIGIGVRAAWLPPELEGWIRVEGETVLVTAGPSREAVTAPLPPDEWLTRRERDVEPAFLAATGRLVLEVPFGPGDVRLLGGGGVVSDGGGGVVLRGLGWTGDIGGGRLALDWERWSLSARGDRVRVGVFDGEMRREVLGRWEESVEPDLLRLSVSWPLGRPVSQRLPR